jgi:hypothetical protein
MTESEIRSFFEKHHDSEFLQFDRIENKRSGRPDLHAFLLVNDLVPGTTDIVSSAGHDEIWLAVGLEELSKVATEEQIVELIRCGVRVDDYGEGLAMFV